MKKIFLPLLILFPFISGCSPVIEKEAKINDTSFFHYFGRSQETTSNQMLFAFSGSGFEVKVNIFDENNHVNFAIKSILNGQTKQYISLFVDDELIEKKELGSTSYDLKFENLTKGYHYVKVLKNNEGAFSKIYLQSFECSNSKIVTYDKTYKKRVEIYGDSITCGYGNLATSQYESFSMETEDALQTYGYLACKENNYDYSIVSVSGLSLAMNVFGSNTYLKDIYKTADTSSKFDTKNNHVDIAVINIGTNDNTYFKNLSYSQQLEKVEVFFNEYKILCDMMKLDNPNVKFILCYNMMELFNGLLETAIQGTLNYLNNKYGDCAISLEMILNNKGADGHPNKDGHIANATLLSETMKNYD